MNPYLCVLIGTPRRVLGTLVGLLVIFAVIAPETFNRLMDRAFIALWPWIQVGLLIMIFVSVINAIFGKKGGGGKKDG